MPAQEVSTPQSQQTIADRFLSDTREFNRRAQELGLGDLSSYYWYHTVELPQELVTPGLYDFRGSLSCFPFAEDMSGMRVLDVGSATGYFAFEFERRGARVVSVELPSLYDLDRFPGQDIEQTLDKIRQMIIPRSMEWAAGQVPKLTAEQLYFYLLEGPFAFCARLLGSRAERCYSTIYNLSSAGLEANSFDLVFMGDVLLHTLNPLQALTAVAPLCRRELVLSQVIPESANNEPVMYYVGGDEPAADEVSWWLPSRSCLVQLLRKLGFRKVFTAGKHSGILRPSGHVYDRAILRAIK